MASLKGNGRRVKGHRGKAAGEPTPVVRPMPGENAEAWADRRELLKAMAKSDGFKLVGRIVRAAEELDELLVRLVEDHGQGTGSPLARYARRHDTGIWEDVDHFLYDLRGFYGTVEAELPPLPAE